MTITPDEYNKVGNFSLKSKIDMNTSFTLTGKVNLGSNLMGADGIGFAFHNAIPQILVMLVATWYWWLAKCSGIQA